eukprot:10142265-Ditylum_brightwellii.AAC.2
MTNEPPGKFHDCQAHDNAFLLKVEEAKLFAEVSDEEFGAWVDEVNAGFCLRNLYSFSNTFKEDEDVPCKSLIQHVNNQEKSCFV